MKNAAIVLGTLGVLVLTGPTATFAYTQETIHTAYHEAPAYFAINATGETSGYTTSGMVFSQTNVPNVAGIRLQRFAIGTAFWYVSDRGVLWADDDLHALSIYLSLS
jgi:hypothetical protein